jgi:elongation factor Ts
MMDKLKQLRAETGVSYAMCQNALKDADGDMDKAREILRAKGAEVAAKKADREMKEGNVFTYIHHNKKIGALVTLLCETDFVAKNDGFQVLGNDIAMHVASTNPENLEALLKEGFIKDPKQTIDDLVKGLILQLGENIAIGEITRFEV